MRGCITHVAIRSLRFHHRLQCHSAALFGVDYSLLTTNGRKSTFPTPTTPAPTQPTNFLSFRNFSFYDISTHDLNSRDDFPNNKKNKKKNKKKLRGKPSYRFVDRARVRVCGGIGGKGSLSMHKIVRGHKLKPDGGHGGNGGHVFIVADPKEQTLRQSNPHIMAQSGSHGSSQGKMGKNGKNTILRVPCGVIVKRILDYDEIWDEENKCVMKDPTNNSDSIQDFNDDDNNNWEFDFDLDDDDDETEQFRTTDEVSSSEEDDDDNNDDLSLEPQHEGDEMTSFDTDDEEEDDDLNSYDEEEDDIDFGMFPEERESVTLADLDYAGVHVLVAEGGKGGKGSCLYASRNGKLPEERMLIHRSKPTEGEVAYLQLELKLIADIGLVGFPNAGKSSLLAAMSRAAPEIAPYPFTTLNPYIGVVEYKDGYKLKAADVPGLIDGASEGRGKGHDFLRHLERTKALLYIVDGAGVDGRNPVKDFQILIHELASYGDGDLINRLALIVLNKVDLLSEKRKQQIMNDLESIANKFGINTHGNVIPISAGVTGSGLTQLSKLMRSIVLKSEEERRRKNSQ